MSEKRYAIASFDRIEAVSCPCGSARRAFMDEAEKTCSVHMVDISEDARTHYHKMTTEVYYILEGEGQIELDGELHSVGPGSSILIKPGCRHRAIGKLKLINIPIPAFDPEDEWFD